LAKTKHVTQSGLTVQSIVSGFAFFMVEKVERGWGHHKSAGIY